MYKSKEDKLAFLDESIKHHDGNVITAVSLVFIQQLKLSGCPVACIFCYVPELLGTYV